jgi:hypothetical protein
MIGSCSPHDEAWRSLDSLPESRTNEITTISNAVLGSPIKQQSGIFLALISIIVDPEIPHVFAAHQAH